MRLLVFFCNIEEGCLNFLISFSWARDFVVRGGDILICIETTFTLGLQYHFQH